MEAEYYCPERLETKVALITGSTHGIGLGIARRFAREGATVVVNDDGDHDGEDVAAALRADGGAATYVRADAGDPDEVAALVDGVVDRYDRIDVLVNNVAGWRHGAFTERSLDDWEFVFDVSLRSHWLTTRRALDHVPRGGSVINVSSIHARATYPDAFPYNVAKSAVNGLTRALAIELGPVEVRANAIMPGAIETRDPDPSLEDLRQDRVTVPAGRRGTPADVAGLAAYLASDDASFVTGAVIPVDGGNTTVLSDDRHARWRADRS